MKTVITNPTALKGLLLLALIANLSHGTSTFKTTDVAQKDGQANMSSEVDREPAQATSRDPGSGDTIVPPTVTLTAAQKAQMKAKRLAEAKTGRHSSGPAKPDNLQTLTPPPAPGAKPEAKPDAKAPVKADTKAAAAPAADAPPIVKLASPAPEKLVTTPAPAAPVIAAAEPAPKKLKVAIKPAKPTKSVKRVAVKHAKVAPAPAELAADVCTDPAACEQARRENLLMKKLSDVAQGLTTDQRKNWVDCTNGNKASCDAYADSVNPHQPKPEALPPIVKTAAPAPFPSADAPKTDSQNFTQMLEDFEKQAIASHKMENDQATKDRIEARMSELFEKLNDSVHSMYDTGDRVQRAAADTGIRRMTSAMEGSLVSANFQLRAKINSLRAIKPGYAVKDSADKFSARMDATAAQMREAQMNLNFAQQTYQSSMQMGQQNMGAYFEMQQDQRDLAMKRQDLMSIDQDYTRSVSASMSQLSSMRSDISPTDYAAYTSSYQQLQTDFQTLMNPVPSTTTTGQFGQTPTVFGQPNQFGNTSAMMQGVQPIQPFQQQGMPYTGAINGFNTGTAAMPFGQSQFGASQYGVAPFPTQTSAFGGCQTSPVYNGYMPTQPTCLAQTNYSLNTQAMFPSTLNRGYAGSTTNVLPFRQ